MGDKRRWLRLLSKPKAEKKILTERGGDDPEQEGGLHGQRTKDHAMTKK
jgi:hypothetical protein